MSSSVVRRWGRAICLIFLLACVVAAFGADAAQEKGGLRGIVQGPEGKAVAGALVAAVPYGGDRIAATTLSRADGTFSLEGLQPGKYGLTATAPGLTAAYLGDLAVEGGRVLEGRKVLLGGEGFTVRGTVKDGDGRPIARAALLAYRFSEVEGDIFQAEADEEGNYAIQLPKATYLLKAEKSGFEGTPNRIKKPEDQTMDLQLTSAAKANSPAPSEVTAWIRANAIPLMTCEAGHGFKDMEPLKKVVGDAHVVALGEATHGTREFFQFKHRMLEFLVSEMGFTVFGIEASYPESLAVNDYVLHGTGDPAKALAGMYFWTWDTEEVLDMIRWMRRYNEDPAHIRKVKFYGFDMQFASVAVQRVLSYVHKVDPAYEEKAKEAIAPMKGEKFARLPQDKKKAMAQGIEILLKRFDDNRSEYVAKSSAEEWTLMRQHLRIIQQCEANQESYTSGGANLRDRFMAENVQWIVNNEGPGTKAVIWAHNGHVSFDGEGYSYGPMGSFLKKALGKDLLVMGFAFDQGSFQAIESNPNGSSRGLIPFTVGPSPKGSLNGALAGAAVPLFVLDIRRVPSDGPVGAWWRKPHKERTIGAMYNESAPDNFWMPLVPVNNYDALFFVEKTTAAKANPSGKRSGGPGSGLKPAPSAGNLSFESGQTGQEPPEWHTSQKGYKAVISDNHPYEGRQCAVLIADPEAEGNFGTLMQKIDGTPYRGKRVRFQAAVRTELSGDGNWAGLWMRVDRKGGQMGFFDNMEDRPITCGEWKVFQVEGDVAADAEELNFGLLLAGSGKAWIDAASLEAVAATVPAKP